MGYKKHFFTVCPIIKNILTEHRKEFDRNLGYVNGEVFTVKYNCCIGII